MMPKDVPMLPQMDTQSIELPYPEKRKAGRPKGSPNNQKHAPQKWTKKHTEQFIELKKTGEYTYSQIADILGLYQDRSTNSKGKVMAQRAHEILHGNKLTHLMDQERRRNSTEQQKQQRQKQFYWSQDVIEKVKEYMEQDLTWLEIGKTFGLEGADKQIADRIYKGYLRYIKKT